jgi:hypothetical protein
LFVLWLGERLKNKHDGSNGARVAKGGDDAVRRQVRKRERGRERKRSGATKRGR